MAIIWRFTPALIAILVYEALPALLFASLVAWLVSSATVRSIRNWPRT